MWSNFPFFLVTNSEIILTRSPLTVQHKHPLLSMIMSSAPVALAATNEPSISTSPYCKKAKNDKISKLDSFKLFWFWLGDLLCYTSQITSWQKKAQSQTSFSITAIRFPWSAVNIWFNNVVCTLDSKWKINSSCLHKLRTNKRNNHPYFRCISVTECITKTAIRFSEKKKRKSNYTLS